MGALEIAAAKDVIDRADAMGVPVPDEIRSTVGGYVCGGSGSYAARVWEREHPDDEGTGCCWGDGLGGPGDCTCWEPEYETEQQPPQLIAGPDEAQRQPAMCGDCAYRPDSPERADEYMAVKLLGLPADGAPFWCHQGIRRPLRWVHPDGRVIPGDPADYKPPIVDGVPYQADGSAALLCAGWANRRARAGRGG